jgi:hypothetical protein
MIETQVLVMFNFFRLSKKIGNHVFFRQGIQVANKWMEYTVVQFVSPITACWGILSLNMKTTITREKSSVKWKFRTLSQILMSSLLYKVNQPPTLMITGC